MYTLFAVSLPAFALTSDAPSPLADLMSMGDEVLWAEVIDYAYSTVGEGEDEAPVTEFELQVGASIQGHLVEGDRVTLRLPGGPFHGGIAMVPGTPRLTVGDTVLAPLTKIEGSEVFRMPRWDDAVYIAGEMADGQRVTLDHQREASVEVSCEVPPLRAYESSRAPALTGDTGDDESTDGLSAPTGPVFAEDARQLAMPWEDLLSAVGSCAADSGRETAP